MAKAQLENGFMRIANEIINALAASDLKGRELRVFLAIMRETYGWNTKAKPITLARIGELTRIDRRHVAGIVRSLLVRKMIKRNGVTGIETDLSLWSKVTPSTGAPSTGLPCKVSPMTPPTVSKVTPPTVSPLLIKDNEIQLKTTGADKPLQPHQAFVKAWQQVYTERTGSPFKASKLDFIQTANLIKEYGFEECMVKARALADLCASGERWPARNGWADFTISNLVRNWNSIINQVRISDQEMKDQKFMQKLSEERKRNERIGELLNTA